VIEVEVEDEAWTQALAEAEAVVVRAAEAALHVLPRVAGEGDPEGVEGACQPYAPSVASRHLPRFTGEDVLISILLTDDDALADLNGRFLGKPYPTNVLSFPAPPNPEGHLGDIALAYGVCAREAREQGKTLQQHLAHLTVHGVLHLLGYDHESDGEAEVMEALERAVLEVLGVPDPYAAERP
jgi:probable rRNA maturation factor